MWMIFFRVACAITAIDVLARYHPKTAKLKYPAAKVIEKSMKFVSDVCTDISTHMQKMNEGKDNGNE